MNFCLCKHWPYGKKRLTLQMFKLDIDCIYEVICFALIGENVLVPLACSESVTMTLN